MPIYLYECDQCGIRFEKLQRMTADPLTDCPECEGHVHRVIQPVGIIFRGSGFYVTDNRKSSSPTLATSKDSDKKKEEKPASGGETKTEAKSETTPAEKGDD